MALRRIGALLVAAALIVGAVLLRRALDDDATADAPPSPSAPESPGRRAAALVCITELRAVCDAVRAEHPDLAVTVEAAGVTLDRLARVADVDEAPLWLTIEPFPAMVDSLRSAARLDALAAEATPVAVTQLVLASPTDGRADVLARACAGSPLWRCVGERAGTRWTDLGGQASWNTLRPALGAVDAQAQALASFAAAVAGYLGTADVRASAWEADPAFTPWVNRLARAVSTSSLSGGTPLGTMASRPSALDLAATSAAEAAALGGDRFALNYPEPSMWLEAVLAVPRATAAPAGLLDDLASAAATAGWDAPRDVPQRLPGATTMLALRARWQELS